MDLPASGWARLFVVVIVRGHFGIRITGLQILPNAAFIDFFTNIDIRSGVIDGDFHDIAIGQRQLQSGIRVPQAGPSSLIILEFDCFLLLKKKYF